MDDSALRVQHKIYIRKMGCSGELSCYSRDRCGIEDEDKN